MLSTLIGLVWVFLVSIAYRGWVVSNLKDMIFYVGVAFIVVRLFELAGGVSFLTNKVRRHDSKPA